MSKPFDSSHDEAWAESELSRACAELDGHIPDGYFEDFSTRLAATLEAEPMETIGTSDLNDPTAMPPGADSGSERDGDEHSGLHEIKALASSARAKIRRRTTEHDIEDSLLASSSSGLPAVVLPDPERSTPGMAILSSSSPSLDLPIMAEAEASSGSTSFGAGIAERSAPKPWLWIAIGTTAIVAAGAAVFFVLQNNKADTGDTVAVSTPVETPKDPTPKDLPAAARAPEKAQSAPVVAALEDPDELSAGDEAENESEPAADAPPKPEEAKSDNAQEKRLAKAEPAEKKNKAKARGDESKGANGVLGGATAVPEDKTEKPAGSGEEGGDINAILDEVTGGPSKVIEDDEEEEKKPDKKRLGSSDVKKAMGGVRGRVNRCGEKTGFTGRVAMKFSVAPSGKVTKAKAQTSNPKVARCVEAAVKRARFPTFEPPSMSFSYPFLITD